MNKNITFKAAVIVLGSVFVTINSVAAENNSESASNQLFGGWVGKASFGATMSTGSAETSNINGSVRLGKTVNNWEHIVFGSLFKGESAIIREETDANGDPVVGEDGQPVREIIRGNNSIV